VGNPFDFVAVYLILEDLWYIIPTKMLRGKFSIRLYPGLKRSKYDPYREAWHELPGSSAKSGTVASIEACAEEEMSFKFSLLGSQREGSQMQLTAT
jgi:hypothetical protein